MSKQKIIVLMGMPGSGKSTLGKQLGKKLGLPFQDLDVLLEQAEQCSIPQLFEQRGEAYFRQRESEILREVLLRRPEPLVLATGGGTPCFFDNLEVIRQKSTSIYLEVDWPLLAQRLGRKSGQRPLLQGMSELELATSLAEKFGWRIPFYQQADIQIKIGANDAPHKIAAQLATQLLV